MEEFEIDERRGIRYCCCNSRALKLRGLREAGIEEEAYRERRERNRREAGEGFERILRDILSVAMWERESKSGRRSVVRI